MSELEYENNLLKSERDYWRRLYEDLLKSTENIDVGLTTILRDQIKYLEEELKTQQTTARRWHKAYLELFEVAMGE